MDLQSIVGTVTAQLQSNVVLDVVLVLLVLALIRTVMLSRRITLLTRGENGKSLEAMIRTLDTRSTALETHAAKTETALNNLDSRVQNAVRGVSVRRFDPFQNSGGQQSFTSALLNEHGDGIVISGIHARDGVRVYAKEVKAFTSERELSEDEVSAIADAKKKLTP